MLTPTATEKPIGLRINPTITLSHVGAMLGLLYAVFAGGSDMRSEIAVQEVKIQNIKADAERTRAEIIQQLRDINDKLDRLNRRQ